MKKTLYLECYQGAAGDMLMGALYELLPDKDAFARKMNSLHPDITVTFQPAVSYGVAGTRVRVLAAGQEEHSHDHHDGHDHGAAGGHPAGHETAHDEAHHSHHHHATLADINAIIDGFDLPETVRNKAKEVYNLLAGAESKAHGVAVGEVHFHEVGALDAVADITGVCYAMELLAADWVIVSPVNTGYGQVQTSHGLLAVPAPATANLLEGMPFFAAGDVPGERCTPTGAVLLKAFAREYGGQPNHAILSVGCGVGSKDFGAPNCLRAYLCDRDAPRGTNDQVCELKANIDDMTGEALGFAMERLLEAGALDVFYTPVQTKKNRPAVLLTTLCKPADADRLAAEILRHTTTFGVRRTDCGRYAMQVASETVETAYGPIRRKTGTGYGVTKSKWEYEDLSAAAKQAGIPIAQVVEALKQ